MPNLPASDEGGLDPCIMMSPVVRRCMPFVCFVFRWPPGIPISHLSDQPLCVPRRLAKVGEIEQSLIEEGVAAATRLNVLTSMR